MAYQFSRFSVLFLGILLINGCAYMDKRMADFKDIGTLAIETRGVNAEIQILPLTLGAGYANGKGYGLRSGTIGEYEYKEYGVAIIGRKIFKGTSERGEKDYDYMYANPFSSSPGIDENKNGPRVHPLGKTSPAYWWNVEAAVHLGVGIRAGVNLAELLDFFLGFAGIDILNDDKLKTN